MSRAGTGDTVIVKPASNIYTVLSAVAVVALILALVTVWMKGDELFGGLLTQGTGTQTTPMRR
ncbi:MAG: hypothetical protein ACHRHE_16125 [Tepidisphaerales bacterium]